MKLAFTYTTVFLAFAATSAYADDSDTTLISEAFGVEEISRGFQAVERWQIDDARVIAERAYREQPENGLALALIAEVKMNMSDYQGAVEYFRRAKAAGVPEQLLSNAMLAEKAQIATEGYEEYVGEHFIVRYKPGKDAILVPYVLDTLEKSRQRVGELLGWAPKTRVIVEIYPSAATLASVSTLTEEEIQNSGTIALCRWNRLMVTSPRAIVHGYGWRDTLSHELTHLIIGGASKNTVPIWLHEGIAKFAETAWQGEPGEGLALEQQIMVRDAAKKNKLIPFEKMHPSMAKLKSQEETALAFAEVFTFIEFLVERKGWEGMRSVLSMMGNGASDSEAVEAVHGKPLKVLADQWMKTLKTREPTMGKKGKAGGAERKLVIKDRPDTPDDQLHGLNKKGRRFARAADLLYTRGRLKAAQKELEKAYVETQSPLISGKLAMIALATNDLPAAERAARQAIEGTPDMAGPNVTLAEILIRQNKLADAKAPLERAISVNPFDPRIHHFMLLVLGENGDAKERQHAHLALSMLSDNGAPPVRTLGHGGLVQIEALPFSRVYVVRNSEDRKMTYSTGMVTPTAPLRLKPGTIELRLVPPNGKEVTRTVTVLETKDDGPPQLITPDTTGS